MVCGVYEYLFKHLRVYIFTYVQGRRAVHSTMEAMHYPMDEGNGLLAGKDVNGNGEMAREDSMNQKASAELYGSRVEDEGKTSVYLDNEDGGNYPYYILFAFSVSVL